MTVVAWSVIVLLGTPIVAVALLPIFLLLSESWAMTLLLTAVCVIALALMWASHEVGAW